MPAQTVETYGNDAYCSSDFVICDVGDIVREEGEELMGCIIGVFIGALVGLLIGSLCSMAACSDCREKHGGDEE